MKDRFGSRYQPLEWWAVRDSRPAAIADNPAPAYAVLENLWAQSHARSARRQVTSHLEKIGCFYTNGIVPFLEPNTHAKFIVSESNIYEGSGNLTYYGLNVNVEVYNFYPSRSPGIYAYASRSYIDFLTSYLADFVDWKSGSTYLQRATQLGTTIRQIADQFAITFNPKVSRDKIDTLMKARDNLIDARSRLWRLPGHRLLLGLDLSLVTAQRQLAGALSRLFRQVDKELEPSSAESISESLEKVVRATNYVGEHLKVFPTKTQDFLVWYEVEYLEKNLSEAKRFTDYLKRKDQ